MNAPQAHAVEANSTSADSRDAQHKRRAAMFGVINRRDSPETTSWMEEEQIDAEMEFMIAEMAGKNHRELRRSLAQ